MTSPRLERSLAPVARSIERVFDCGWSPIPVAPPGAVNWQGKQLSGAGKAPAEFVRNHWRGLRGWEMHGRWHVYHLRDGTRVDRGEPMRMGENGRLYWASMPGANLGIAIDRRFLCLDIDDDDPDVRFAIRSLIEATCKPGALIGKRGQKGETLFLAQPELGAASNMKLVRSTGNGAIDILAEGRQTVVPYSIHPSTLEPYTYTTDDTCEDATPADLPRPRESFDRFFAALIETLEPIGYRRATSKPRSSSALRPLPNASRAAAIRMIADDLAEPKWVRFDAELDLRTRRRLEGIFRHHTERVSVAAKGTRHTTLLSAARLLGGHLRYRAYSPEEVFAGLFAASIANGHVPEDGEAVACAAIRDGLENGFKNPLALEAQAQ